MGNIIGNLTSRPIPGKRPLEDGKKGQYPPGKPKKGHKARGGPFGTKKMGGHHSRGRPTKGDPAPQLGIVGPRGP